MVENFSKEHKSSETLLAEYRERLRFGRDENALGRRAFDFWQNCYLATCELANSIIVHVDKYNPIANRWEQFRKIRFSTERKNFEVVNVCNKSFIIGGKVGADYVTSVSCSIFLRAIMRCSSHFTLLLPRRLIVSTAIQWNILPTIKP